MEKFVEVNTVKQAENKYLCPLSGKKFKGAEFVRKHIFNKHSARVEEVKQEVSGCGYGKEVSGWSWCLFLGVLVYILYQDLPVAPIRVQYVGRFTTKIFITQNRWQIGTATDRQYRGK